MSVTRYGSRTARVGSRSLSRSVACHNSSTPLPPVKKEPQPVIPQEKPSEQKKKFSIFGLLWKTLLVGSVAYGGTLYAATKNDKVFDFVIDKNLPYHEEIMKFMERGSFEDLKSQVNTLSDKASQFKLPSKDQLDELTSKLEHQGGHIIEETKKKFENITPAEQLQKPVEIEPVQKSVEHFPLVSLNKASTSIDSSVRDTIESFNDFIRSIDASKIGNKNDTLVKAINDSISSLSEKINSLTTKFDDELQSKLKIRQTELLSSYTKKELEMTENFLHQFNQEKTRLESKLNQTLKLEIEAAKKAIDQAAVNAVSMVRIEQTKKFEKLVKDRIDNERNGRLANLDKLIARVDELEKFSLTLEKQLLSNHQKTVVQKSLSNLKTLIYSNSNEVKLFKPYIQDLIQVSQQINDDVINLALKDLTTLLSQESNKSILTNSQLLTRWEQLSPELRSASLLPPNAGLLGHLASLLFSKLLLPVKGSNPNGKDIESVIARVGESLTKGELDIAVEEAANLKGWSRELARDWVMEGRKRLEAEFLINLIDTETKIM